MSLAERKNRKRRDEFFNELEQLMARYPELVEPNEDYLEHLREVHGDKFVENSPKMITGIVLTISCRNAEDWEDLIWIQPYSQSHFQTVGMLTNTLNMLR